MDAVASPTLRHAWCPARFRGLGASARADTRVPWSYAMSRRSRREHREVSGMDAGSEMHERDIRQG